MNKEEVTLLKVCLEDELFAALFKALIYFEKEWETGTPVEVWVSTLIARGELVDIPHPELFVERLFDDLPDDKALLCKAVLFWMRCYRMISQSISGFRIPPGGQLPVFSRGISFF